MDGGRPMDLLRFSTAGSVDDGKSTLIGRLLYDSKGIFEDQLAAIERTSLRRGNAAVDLALLTDGLRAEREQGITIDVAYRYFATPRRKFIIADTPGHVQYTRNMVTGASTADLGVVLIDARKGVLEQSRRHAFICSLLGIPHIVVAVNKMDLVDYSQDVFEAITADFTAWSAKLDVHDVTFIPISALHGDNVVERSTKMQWYQGPSLLYHLEHVHIASDRNLIDNRFPVQWIVRPMSDEHHDYRGYAGQVASGQFKVGDEVVVLPSGARSRIKQIDTFDGQIDEAIPPLSVTLLLEDDIDVSRGDMICRPHNQPTQTQELELMCCWMHERQLQVGGRYWVKHTTRNVRGIVDAVRYRIDVNSLHRDQGAETLGLNEIGRLRLRTSSPLLVDEYRRNRLTGSLILVDETTNETVGAAMVVGAEELAAEEDAEMSARAPEDQSQAAAAA
ncbi:MAG TPA: sulfate adenylyltransferase subunit CysN [Candidatus Limnocylindrales bacterium]|nr:sulfate adenylyltransferase subunit CysN [Candidatus Limnocylindrales bacterium]